MLPKTKSSRSQIRIKEVRDNILVLPNNNYCLVLETSSVNFELKSEAEQDVLLDSFQNFLNSLPTKLQVLIRIRELDIDLYLEELKVKAEAEKEAIYKKQLHNYQDFIKTLVSGNKILSRRFYIVIPYKPEEKSDFNLIKEQLALTTDVIIKGFEKMGMKAVPLENLEILQLFYSFYSPEEHKIQPLNKDTFNLINTYGTNTI